MPDQDFTALCKRKAEHIGQPVGLLVENDAGALAAVHNLGRVTWLDDCIQGPKDLNACGLAPQGQGGSVRARFEHRFPVPGTMEWREDLDCYAVKDGVRGYDDECQLYNAQWIGWEASQPKLDDV